jgi:uncharacterized membrane protein
MKYDKKFNDHLISGIINVLIACVILYSSNGVIAPSFFFISGSISLFLGYRFEKERKKYR